MAETQEAMMRKLEDVSGMIKTQSLKLTTQSEATDAQSTQVAEQAAKLAALQGAREDTRTSEHRSSSPAPDVRQGSNSVSASRQNVPKFHGEAPQYPMWRNKFLSHLCMFNCREAVATRCDLILGGDKRVMPSELRRRHSTREIDHATRAWVILVEGVVFVPRANKIFQAGSPSGGWKVVEY